MTKEQKLETIEKVKKEIEKIDKKEFNVYFFVLDSKGNPSGELEYIYQIAYSLFEDGYKVTMLHQENEFVGVRDWLGDKYADLPHVNVEKENADISPADFVFIPEIYANVMSQVKNLPCKKVAILHNQGYLTSTIPVGVTWNDFHIYDVVTDTNDNKDVINSYFPHTRSWIVSPVIAPMFRENEEPKKLIINVISKDQTDIDKIIKPFYWKYPVYKWVSFRDLRGIPQETFADALREGVFTIWIDDDTNFGYSLLESMNSGCITLAKVPNNPTDWMVENDSLINGPIWFENLRTLPEMIASVVRSWTLDTIPPVVYENMRKFNSVYTQERQKAEIKNALIEGLFVGRKAELEKSIVILNQEDENNE